MVPGTTPLRAPVGEPSWIVVAKRYLGLHEGPGSADNPAVVRFYAMAGHPEIKHDEVPWCAAFVGAVLHEAGLPNTNSLAARSYERYGIELDEPVYGCIGTKVRKGGGHVTFVLGETPSSFICLGGNQADRVCIEAIGKGDFTSLRWPPGVKLPPNPHPLLVSVPNLMTGLAEA
jgi:uncharacterized protein (TIGR02594 family)